MQRDSRHRCLLAPLWLGVVFLVPLGATGEESDGSDAEEDASGLFERGLDAYRSGRVADARDLFRRSLELEPRFSTAWNLAGMLRATNELVDAVLLLRQILDGRYGAIDEQQRAETSALEQEIEARLATLTIRSSIEESVEVVIDGQPRGIIRGGEPLEILVVSGSHTVGGTSEGTIFEEQSVDLEEGGSATIELSPRAGGGPEEVPPARTPVIRRPWLWVIVGVAVAAITVGAVSLGLYLSEENDPGRYEDPIFGNTFALERARSP